MVAASGVESGTRAAAKGGAAAPQSSCVSRLDLRIAEEIRPLKDELVARLPVRSGIFDLLLPRDPAELKLMNGMAIFALQVFVRESDGGELDLPISAVVHSPVDKKGRAIPDSAVSRLPNIFPVSRVKFVQTDAGIDLRKLLGTHTQIYYGFIPVSLLLDNGVVAARFKEGVTHLEVFRTSAAFQKMSDTPQWLKKISRKDTRLAYSQERLPDAKLTLLRLSESYCIGRGR